MELTTETRNGIIIYRLAGEFDLYAAPEVRKTIAGSIEAGNLKIVLDMGEVDYIDSSGVGVLIRLMQILKAGNGYLKFANFQNNPRKVLELSNLYQFLDVYRTTETALRSFKDTTDADYTKTDS